MSRDYDSDINITIKSVLNKKMLFQNRKNLMIIHSDLHEKNLLFFGDELNFDFKINGLIK